MILQSPSNIFDMTKSLMKLQEKYLESIISVLSRSGLVDALRGKGGGYRLNRPAASYSVGEILRLTEGTLAPVSCLELSPTKAI